MKVVGSVIARLGSKRLPYKNILPFEGKPMLVLGLEKLKRVPLVDEVVLSTESELIARVAQGLDITIIRRPEDLSADDTPSIPVFRHIMEVVGGDLHVNLNINFPLCDPGVVTRAIELAKEQGESLSNPFAVWAQTQECLNNYIDPWNITAPLFEDERAGPIDIHTEADLLETYRQVQGDLKQW